MNLTRAENYEQLGIRLGVSGDAVRQWSVRGLSSKQADFVATELGYYPLSIWENFNDDLDVEFDDADDETVTDHQVDMLRIPSGPVRRSLFGRSSTGTFRGARRKFLGRN
jgi:hypothetical protein